VGFAPAARILPARSKRASPNPLDTRNKGLSNRVAEAKRLAVLDCTFVRLALGHAVVVMKFVCVISFSVPGEATNLVFFLGDSKT
jgi:hypothetical protein